MIEDIMENDEQNRVYKDTPPLGLPQMGPPTSLRTSVSPRFDSLMDRSNSIPWAPTPLNATSHGQMTSDRTLVSPSFVKSSNTWQNNNAWQNNNTWQNKNFNNSYSKPMDSTLTNSNSSNARMISSSDETCGCLTTQISPRCKLGILGFVIGLLGVSIPLAVVLVLWLRK
ncbi:unnamed protein product [Rotaria magnacalcarata]|uniref:Uncharacterized protein n=1 Tax=Rotaria magnacalcarata TaxID=392030 RepID=A0A820H4A4_9BILA|nr:unnamed protein product [Rotaria magnacalcarata]CAF1461251.1 unnamed protein product [Rotaria magnacalcarata]CAF2040536.1 unnamed protein product [Rotaria magnacalcarata]CAF2103481.1 unnamed protein product [Rotaria magnacalcarata]CAF4054575.1 unnamed protein product [Rotaria magnacalcarata]